MRLHYNIREYDPAARSAVMDKVAAWAGDGGWLVLSTRPNQRLYVRPSALPSMGSALKWTEDMEMTLTAYERPFFEARWPSTAVISESGVMYLQGTVPAAFVEVDATNAGDGTLTEITFRCEQTMITLQGLSVPVGGHIKLYYTDTDILVIDADGKSALANRTAESHDDLIATPRKSNAIEVRADQPVSAVFTARGRFR